MSGGRRSALLIVCLAVGSGPIRALPDLSRPVEAGPLRVFPDHRRVGLYYYPPGALRIACGEDGRPEFELLQARYVGTRAAGDQGALMLRSRLTFRILLEGPALAELSAARRALEVGRSIPVELRPMPGSRLETALAWQSLDSGVESAPQPLPLGHLEAEGAAGKASAATYWRERIYSVGLGEADSQLLWHAFREGRVLMSLNYAFSAEAVSTAADDSVISGSSEVLGVLREELRGEASPGAEGRLWVVGSDNLSITVDLDRWPGLLRQVDLNERLPPGYPLIDVYCYDFKDALRADLFAKRVELEAEGAAGDTVRMQLEFDAGSPDLYARGLRFPFAVRMDKPFRYRVVEIRNDGRIEEGAWAEAGWAWTLDVTTRASDPALGVREEQGEDETETV